MINNRYWCIFFSFLNHQPLPMILNKVGFDNKIFCFFSSYLTDRLNTYETTLYLLSSKLM